MKRLIAGDKDDKTPDRIESLRLVEIITEPARRSNPPTQDLSSKFSPRKKTELCSPESFDFKYSSKGHGKEE